MILLALESTSTHCGVALMRGGECLASIQVQHGMNLSGTLLKATEWALQQAGLELAQVDAFAVDVGPGAFTGLKIGVMIAKSWAHALQKPLVAVRAFEACGTVMPAEVPTLVALNARRDALYLQWLLPHAHQLPTPLSEPAMVVREELESWQWAVGSGQRPQIIGTARAKEWLEPLLGAHWVVIESPPVEGVGRVGMMKLQAGETVHPFQLVPFYIQPPSITLPKPR